METIFTMELSRNNGAYAARQCAVHHITAPLALLAESNIVTTFSTVSLLSATMTMKYVKRASMHARSQAYGHAHRLTGPQACRPAGTHAHTDADITRTNKNFLKIRSQKWPSFECFECFSDLLSGDIGEIEEVMRSCLRTRSNNSTQSAIRCLCCAPLQLLFQETVCDVIVVVDSC